MLLEIHLPVTVRVDNYAAIRATKHVDIRTKFVNEVQEDGNILIKFAKSEDNTSDIMTKNLPSVSYNKHTQQLVAKREAFEAI